jgi:hypothetical protein
MKPGACDLTHGPGAERLYRMTDSASHTAQALYNKIAKESDSIPYGKAL